MQFEKEEMKNLLNILLWCIVPVVFVAGLWQGLELGTRIQRKQPYQTVREQVMALQGRVGCTMIDAEIGPESIMRINQAVKAEEPNLFNSFAEPYFTLSGAPDR